VSCSADRQAEAKITAEGIFLEQLEEDPSKYLPEPKEDDLGAEVVKVDLNRPMSEVLAELTNYPIRTRLSLTGTLVVARDIAHAKMQEMIDSGADLPQYIKDHAVYYAGPAKTPDGMASGSFGPTTAGRMDSYVDSFQSKGGSMIMLMKGNSKTSPSPPQDFRSVSLASSLFGHVPPSIMYMEEYGDIAGVDFQNDSFVVEFYDMRAAQQVVLKVPGFRARPPCDGAEGQVNASVSVADVEDKLPLVVQNTTKSLVYKDYMFGSVAASPCRPGGVLTMTVPVAPGLRSTTANFPPGPSQPEQPEHIVLEGVASSPPGIASRSPKRKNKRHSAAAVVPAGLVSNRDAHAEISGNVTDPGNPVYENVNFKDHTKFDIVPQRIRSGEDTRTTLMVRNFPKNSSREDLAVSYGRLQGLEQLIKHFSTSAVMHDKDMKRRPIFVSDSSHENISERAVKDIPMPTSFNQQNEIERPDELRSVVHRVVSQQSSPMGLNPAALSMNLDTQDGWKQPCFNYMDPACGGGPT